MVRVQTGFSWAGMVLTTSHDSMSHILILWSTEPLNRYFSLYKDHMTSCESMQHEIKSCDISCKHQPANTSPAMYMYNIWPTWFHVTSCEIMWTCARSCDVMWHHLHVPYPWAHRASTMPSCPVSVFRHLKLVVSQTWRDAPKQNIAHLIVMSEFLH